MSLSTDEPPVLPIGTDVSAKYKGAFCEAKIKKISRNVKCKLTLKQGNSSVTVDDELISGLLRVGSHVVLKQNNQLSDAVINKIMDQSFYTVVFDDGDEATLKRTSLCLKSGKHFAESETLDQLPLTNPEHFGNPVSLGRRRRRRHHNSDSEDDDTEETERQSHLERDPDWGKVVCVDYGDKRGSKKDIWFPALIVAPTAQEATTKIGKDEHLVRSFRDGRFYQVNKKDAREFTKEMVLSKSESNSSALRSAMEKAVAFMDRQDLPHHWDYDLLMGNVIPQIEEEIETSEEFDSALDESDDEQSEEKDRFVAQLYKYMDERGTPINRAPSVGGKDLNLYKLYRIVVKMGGYNRVTNKNSWRAVYSKLGLPASNSQPGKDSSAVYQLKAAYKKYLHSFDDFYRKLGCTITVNSRTSRPSRGERLREERSSSKKIVKKDKDIKKEDIVVEKEKEKEKETKDVIAVNTKLKDKERDKKLDKEEKDKEKEKEKEKDLKEEVKVEDIKSNVKEVKEEVKPKIEEAPIEERKRGRGRKKREEAADEPPGDDDTMTGQSTIDESEEEDPKNAYKNAKVDESMIKVGDGLKVKYGRGRQLKVYEAKVLKVELDAIKNKNKYFVHYSGWNSRYDEWIKKSRIVQVLRDRSPRRRSGKVKNKGEPLHDVSQTPPNSGTQNNSQTPVATTPTSSQTCLPPKSESTEMVESPKSSQPQPPKRGRPPNSVKNTSSSKEQPPSQPTEPLQSQSQPSPQSSQGSTTPVGRRGRPPTVKKEKLTRSKSMNDDQSNTESNPIPEVSEEVSSKRVKKTHEEVVEKSEKPIEIKEEIEEPYTESSGVSILPPELIDENTVENKIADEDVNDIKSEEQPLIRSNKTKDEEKKVEESKNKAEDDKKSKKSSVEPSVEEILNKSMDSETDESVTHLNELCDVKSAEQSPVKDAFEFDEEEEIVKEEEPLKEQLKKKRKSKDDNKRSKNSSIISKMDTNDKNDKNKDINEDMNKEEEKSNAFTRKNSKKARKTVTEIVAEEQQEEPIKDFESVINRMNKLKDEEKEKVDELKAKPEDEKKTKKTLSSTEGNQKQETKKRKGRKKKEEESVSPVKKKVKPTKLEIPEEDTNLEIQKLFENEISPQEDISLVEEMKILPQFTTDINPSQQESVSSDFLLCEEAVPASPEKEQPMEMAAEEPLLESPQSFHSSPTQSPEDQNIKDVLKGSGGSNSELENEPIITKDEIHKMETLPSPIHDDDSQISRPECSKSPISPKKRRRGRIRTTSQSDSHHKNERIGCKTRGSSGRHKAERHSPLTALEHRSPFSLNQISFHNFVPESKYNFCAPIDESIDADRRINILQERLSELRRTYLNIKSEVAILDRKKKKARRKEREKKEFNNNHNKSSSNNSGSNSGDAFNNSSYNKQMESFAKDLMDSHKSESISSTVPSSSTTSAMTTASIT